MSDLVLRKLSFDFDGVAFNWHQGDAPFAMMMNTVRFQVMGFEHHMCRTMRDAVKVIIDPAVLAEARVFLPRHAIA